MQNEIAGCWAKGDCEREQPGMDERELETQGMLRLKWQELEVNGDWLLVHAIHRPSDYETGKLVRDAAPAFVFVRVCAHLVGTLGLETEDSGDLTSDELDHHILAMDPEPTVAEMSLPTPVLVNFQAAGFVQLAPGEQLVLGL